VPDPISRLNAALSGRYRIERELGQGGMATVYLARDEKHNRKVALKVLKPELAAVVGAERFLAEIETTANLQHPHILPLFDSGEADSFLFYVMPYVEGETLRDRLDREHQLPVDEAVQIAKNVAEALDYAHRHGVIHRDIKPANILLQDGKPVISDFGIALAVGVAGGGRLTETGLSLGTPHYMSPEQATGDVGVGAATDVYALGCVLYEMLVGEPPYTGSTAQAILGKIIGGKLASATEHRRSVPPHVEAAIGKALEKLPADRFTGAQDFAKALGDAGFRHGVELAAGATAARGQWTPVAKGASALAVVLGVGLAWSLATREPPPPVSRHILSTEGLAGPDVRMGLHMAVAPDGSSMVVPVEAAGGFALGLKLRGSAEITPIPGTEGAGNAAYSPDAQSIVYRIGSDLFKRSLAGGSAVRIADDAESGTADTPVAVAWLDDGTLLYERQEPGELVQIPENGGEPRVVFQPGSQTNWVEGLPGARAALVGNGPSVFILDLGDLSSEVLIEAAARAWYASTGHLVLVRDDGAVSAVRFDLGALTILGGETPLFAGVGVVTSLGTVADMQLAADGTLLYAEGTAGSRGALRLVLVDRTGGEEPLGFEPGGYLYPRYSPDGRRLGVALADDAGTDLWVLDLDRGSRTRVTFSGTNRFYPLWTPAGDQLTFSPCMGNCTGSDWLVRAAADGSGQMDTLLTAGARTLATSWSRDGTVLFYEQVGPRGKDVWALREGTPEMILGTPFQERNAAISPDGRWLAYESDRSGAFEIYVRPYPGPGPEATISTQGGLEPVWAPDGSEIFFRSEGRLMAVAVDVTNGLRAASPRRLFDGPYLAQGANGPNYDVAPDGEHFVLMRTGTDEGGRAGRLILVENFFEELKARVPN